MNAIVIVNALTNALAELDPDNAETYRANGDALALELMNLDAEFRTVVENGTHDVLVFADRNPFRHFAHAYGLYYHSALDGCGTETQASPQDIAAIITHVEDAGIPVVLFIEFSNQNIADVVVEATGVKALEFHSAHNVTQAEYEAGITVVDIFRRNLEVLREALG